MTIKDCIKYLMTSVRVILKKKNPDAFINGMVFEALKSLDHKE